MKRVPCLRLLLLVCVFGGLVSSSFAQGQMPTGEGIGKAAKTAKLNPSASVTSEKKGKKVTVTPIDFSLIKTSTDLETGRVVGMVDVKGISGLPDGQYNIFTVKTNGRWRAFFEFDGKIVKEANRVELRSTTKPNARKVNVQPVAEITPLGWYVCVYDKWICFHDLFD